LKNHLPPQDLLEATHDFPCPYTFKIIGLANESFIQDVVSAVRKGMQFDFDPPYESRESSGGKHIALTFEPVAENSTQVLSVYSEIQTIEGVILLL
tara:strand:- start:468 stop:755 length:288 start_codon:yes stop_codon:yes gene_type:complete